MQSASNPRRRAYRSPRLQTYGPIAEITRGGAMSMMSDHGMNMMFGS